MLGATALSVSAAPLTVEDYFYNPGGGPNVLYGDTTPPTKLTNGETGSPSSWYNGTFLLWNTSSPSITFNFAPDSEITSFSIYFLNESSAGITVPTTVTLTDVATNETESFTIDPATFGPADAHWVQFDLSVPFVTSQVVVWTSPAPGAGGPDWVAMSEVSFQTIPEPSVMLLLGGGLCAVVMMRRLQSRRRCREI